MTNEHALLVGASRGLGLVTARSFATRGSTVSIIARRILGDTTFPSIHGHAADICNPADTRETLATIVREHRVPTRIVFFQRYRGSEPDWEAELATSLTATRRIIDLLVTDHDLRNAGIVLVSSINAHLISGHLPLGYHIAKAGLIQMARHYAVVLGSRGIRINSVSPGTFLKPESQHTILEDPARRQFYETITPLGRPGTAAEVAQVIDFLSGPLASFVTGQDLIVDGGVSLRFQETVPAHSPPNPAPLL